MADTTGSEYIIVRRAEYRAMQTEARERDAEIATLMSDLAATQQQRDRALEQLDGRERRDPMSRTRKDDAPVLIEQIEALNDGALRGAFLTKDRND